MNKCQNCKNYVEPNSTYCWFHHIKVRKISKIQKLKHKKKSLILIPDLLLIVFEYAGYENYLIFNFLEPTLTLDLLKQKIIDLDNQMFHKLSGSITSSIISSVEYQIMIHRESKNFLNYDYYERVNSQKMIIWCTTQIHKIIKEYKDIQAFDLIDLFIIINENSIIYHLDNPSINFGFNIQNYKFAELSGFWKLVYQVLEINKEYQKIRDKIYLK